MTATKIVTFGESLLRLTPPGFERFLQTPHFNAVFGGAEANVAVALASFGLDVAYVTVLPENNPLADAAVAELRRFGVDVGHVVRGKGRLGMYFLEPAAHHRAGRVVYDREHSAMALAKPGDIPWDGLLQGTGWFHITGITPAISSSAADLAIEGMRRAKEKGLTVSFDLNYRQNLWKWGKSAAEVMAELIRVTDLLIANEEHVRMVIGGPSEIRNLTEHVLKAYPNLKAVAVSQHDAGSWSASLNDRKEFITSRRYDLTHSVDRIGSGDAFAAGLIYGWQKMESHQEALDFAAAASCLKHSIPGDYCRATVDEVRALLTDHSPGRISR